MVSMNINRKRIKLLKPWRIHSILSIHIRIKPCLKEGMFKVFFFQFLLLNVACNIDFSTYFSKLHSYFCQLSRHFPGLLLLFFFFYISYFVKIWTSALVLYVSLHFPTWYVFVGPSFISLDVHSQAVESIIAKEFILEFITLKRKTFLSFN